MSVRELKGDMVDLLAKVNDQELLQEIYLIVNEMIIHNLNKTDFWDELSSKQQKELEQALAESDNPENIVAHEVVKNELVSIR